MVPGHDDIGGSRVLGANFSLAAGLRPAWWVLIAGVAILILSETARRGWGRKRKKTGLDNKDQGRRRALT